MKSVTCPKKPTHPQKEIQYDMESQIKNIKGMIQDLTLWRKGKLRGKP
jgi:hypothetical protein